MSHIIDTGVNICHQLRSQAHCGILFPIEERMCLPVLNQEQPGAVGGIVLARRTELNLKYIGYGQRVSTTFGLTKKVS
jgi:hypothetical protein